MIAAQVGDAPEARLHEKAQDAVGQLPPGVVALLVLHHDSLELRHVQLLHEWARKARHVGDAERPRAGSLQAVQTAEGDRCGTSTHAWSTRLRKSMVSTYHQCDKDTRYKVQFPSDLCDWLQCCIVERNKTRNDEAPRSFMSKKQKKKFDNVANSMEPPNVDATPEDATTMDPSRAAGPRTHGPADEPTPRPSQTTRSPEARHGLHDEVRVPLAKAGASSSRSEPVAPSPFTRLAAEALMLESPVGGSQPPQELSFEEIRHEREELELPKAKLSRLAGAPPGLAEHEESTLLQPSRPRAAESYTDGAAARRAAVPQPRLVT